MICCLACKAEMTSLMPHQMFCNAVWAEELNKFLRTMGQELERRDELLKRLFSSQS